jgi:hypothetical protein
VGASGAGEIPLPLSFFYLFGDAGLGATSPPSSSKDPRGPTRAEDIVRWGVWLGRHIC